MFEIHTFIYWYVYDYEEGLDEHFQLGKCSRNKVLFSARNLFFIIITFMKAKINLGSQ